MGDAHGNTDPLRQLPYGGGKSGRVQSARVGDDPHAPLVGEPQALLQLPQEGLRVTGVRVLHPVPAEDEHGQLGEIVTGQDVERAAGEHLAQCVEAVTVEAGGVPDPQYVGGAKTGTGSGTEVRIRGGTGDSVGHGCAPLGTQRCACPEHGSARRNKQA